MWFRTLLAVFLAGALNSSLMLNVALLTPIERANYALLSFVGGFILWSALATVFYCYINLKQLLIIALPTLLASASLNTFFALRMPS
ncbi:hypothetical protein [Marinagarivorans algicola]|uniref:hypothetical protein n=1 Tax=Marinagarivorans algicola TaxID=1513270 RepID=UPI0006B5E898|nr:hypothetical protein [Marinagarivorans algicola]